MSVVILPSSLLAIGAIRVEYVLMIEVSSAAAGTSRVTITLLAVTDERTMSWVRRSYLKLVSVKSRPKDDAEVTSRCWPFGSGTLQTYGAWVWPEMIMSIWGSRLAAIGRMAESATKVPPPPQV